MNEPEVIRDMLGKFDNSGKLSRSLAVVGLSDNPMKPSHSVSAYMQSHGYRILPVNPAVEDPILTEPVYPSLAALVATLSAKPDVVNVFRLPRAIPAVVEEMIELGLKNLWVQLGIINLEAATRAEAAGINVVMDRCILIEHRRLGL